MKVEGLKGLALVKSGTRSKRGTPNFGGHCPVDFKGCEGAHGEGRKRGLDKGHQNSWPLKMAERATISWKRNY